MRIDHLAYRLPWGQRKEATQFYIEAFGYTVQQEFKVDFDDGTFTECTVLEPPSKFTNITRSEFAKNPEGIDWILHDVDSCPPSFLEYHLPPEIFISEGSPGSIVDQWVKARGGQGGLHHQAMQVEDVKATMVEWQQKGWAEFTSDVLTCPEDDLDQIFTKPNKFSGVIYEFIKRGKDGFCNKNVKRLMESTKDLE